jgi:glyoxylase-like metal-dependent hydrolase (beta-lactamase superfamily II)
MTNTAERMRRVSGLRSLMVGELKVSFVPDGAIKVRARGLLPSSGEDDWAANPEYLDEHACLTAGHGGLLVEHGDRALLIDAGYGPSTAQLPQDSPVFVSMYGGALLDGLAQLGRDPDTIEAVAVTHLHVEHIGWACHRPDDGRPAFHRAEVLISEPEWSARQPHLGVTETMLDTLEPRVRAITDGQEIFPGVRAVVLPGHTPGHTAYEITSGNARLLAFGDAMHSAIQITHPDWTAVREPDPESSRRSRRWVISQLGRPGTLGFGIHFADAVFGRPVTSLGRQVWQPLECGAGSSAADDALPEPVQPNRCEP